MLLNLTNTNAQFGWIYLRWYSVFGWP